jgi:hypothetical protein
MTFVDSKLCDEGEGCIPRHNNLHTQKCDHSNSAHPKTKGGSVSYVQYILNKKCFILYTPCTNEGCFPLKNWWPGTLGGLPRGTASPRHYGAQPDSNVCVEGSTSTSLCVHEFTTGQIPGCDVTVGTEAGGIGQTAVCTAL